MFRIDKSTVGPIDEKTPYVMDSIYVKPAQLPLFDEEPQDGEDQSDHPVQIERRRDVQAAAVAAINAANTKAGEIIKDAKLQAQEILRQNEAECARLRESAFKEGYAKGEREAGAVLRAAREQDLRDLNSLMGSVKQAHASMIDEAEYDLLVIAVEAARKIVRYELSRDDDIYISFVRNALDRIRVEGKVKVLVDGQAYGRFINKFGPTSIMDDGMEIGVSENPSYETGDATVQFGDESIELSVDSQIEVLKRELGIVT